MESGHTPSREHAEYWDGNVPWVGIKDAREHHGHVISNTQQQVTQLGLDNSAARRLPPGTVCLSRTASVGYVTILGKEMATSQDFANWICTEALLPEFLMYALIAEGEHIKSFGEGTTHTTIYFPELKALHICLPPLEEQKEVVRRVQKLLNLEATLANGVDHGNETMSKLDQSILAAAFRGELVPQDPNDEPAAAMLARLRADSLPVEKGQAASPVKQPRKRRA